MESQSESPNDGSSPPQFKIPGPPVPGAWQDGIATGDVAALAMISLRHVRFALTRVLRRGVKSSNFLWACPMTSQPIGVQQSIRFGEEFELTISAREVSASFRFAATRSRSKRAAKPDNWPPEFSSLALAKISRRSEDSNLSDMVAFRRLAFFPRHAVPMGSRLRVHEQDRPRTACTSVAVHLRHDRLLPLYNNELY